MIGTFKFFAKNYIHSQQKNSLKSQWLITMITTQWWILVVKDWYFIFRVYDEGNLTTWTSAEYRGIHTHVQYNFTLL